MREFKLIKGPCLRCYCKVEHHPDIMRKFVLGYILEMAESSSTGDLYIGSMRRRGAIKIGRWFTIGKDRYSAIEQPIYYK